MIISNQKFSLLSLSSIHSIKFKLELTSINVLLQTYIYIYMYTLLLFSSSSPFYITRQIKYFILPLSLSFYVANTTTLAWVNREQTSLYYIPIHTSTFSYSYWPIHLSHTYTSPTTTTTTLTRYYLNLTFSVAVYFHYNILDILEVHE